MDTIFALASAPGKAGVAVIRMSGPKAFSVARFMTQSQIQGRGMWLRTLLDHEGDPLDDALVLGFLGPQSFTGEDVVEFQVHGSVAGVQSVLAELGRHEGCRLAEPGEFTRRALENGRMDLSQVEGLADLIDSETEAQRRQAHRLLSGDLGAVADGWRERLIRAASLLEVTIDFADEEVPEDVSGEVSDILTEVLQDLETQRDGVRIAERIRTGFEVAIVGPPNIGKSTLLNRLAGRKAALTSDVAGTTRDIIEVRMDLDGLPVTLLDTAGLRETSDKVETMGIDLAIKRASQADLRVILHLPGDRPELDPLPGDIVIEGKSDLTSDGMGVSGLTGQGVDELIELISRRLKDRTSSAGLATRERHREALDRAAKGVGSALSVLSQGPDLYDLAAEELRYAIRSLEILVGRIDVESLLDEIFSSFCLGK